MLRLSLFRTVSEIRQALAPAKIDHIQYQYKHSNSEKVARNMAIVARRNEGLSYQKIGCEFGITKAAVRAIVLRYQQRRVETEMCTKNNPGEFDCYNNAEPDEPMFILLGRDQHAPAAVRKWAFDREVLIEKGVKPATDMRMVIEARECADAMERFCVERSKGKRNVR